MSGPATSVIMCVRDGESYLCEALDSIAAQGHPSLEVIVVDDGSRDRSSAIAQSHALKPIVVMQKLLGFGAALNRGLSVASGTILGFLDCDDVWPAGRLRAMLGVLADDPRLDAVYGKVVNTDFALTPIWNPVAVQLIGAMLIRRDAALRVGEFRTDVVHAAILDWISRARASGLRFRALDRIVLLRRIHGDNLGIRDKSSARGDLLDVIRSHRRRRKG